MSPSASAPSLETVAVSLDGAVGRVELRRPEKLNALTPAMLSEVAAAAEWLDGREEVAAVVVVGAGRAFCAGFDLGSMAETYAGADRAREVGALGRAMADAVGGLRAMTVAAVHGRCVGGGVVLAAACDLRVVERDAILSIPELDLGIPLAWGGVPRLVRDLGPMRVKELVSTCRSFDGEEALAIGFATRLAEPGGAGAAARALAAEVAARGALTTAQTKAQADRAASGRPDGAAEELDRLLAALADEPTAAVRGRYVKALAARRAGRAG